MEPSSVAFVILNWNGREYTPSCLDSLSQAGLDFSQITVVDNHSEDGSYEYLLENYPTIDLIRNPTNLGFTGGNNVGIRKALEKGYEYVFLLNNDTEVQPDFLHFLVEEMEASKETAAIQPLIYYLKDRLKVWNAGGVYNSRLSLSQTVYQPKSLNASYETDWITGCAIMVRATVIREVGLLDEGYFAYFEDVDWSLRMRKAGYGLKVHPSAVIYHEAGASSKTKKANKEGFLNPKVHYLNVRNQIYQIKKHADLPARLVSWPLHFFRFGLIALYFLIRGRKSKLAAIIKGMRDGLRTRTFQNYPL
jgi:GT2 family glycosyltransferase